MKQTTFMRLEVSIHGMQMTPEESLRMTRVVQQDVARIYRVPAGQVEVDIADSEADKDGH